MIHIEWTNTAFSELEDLEQTAAYEIIQRIDYLSNFPEMGAPLESRFDSLREFRQLVIKRNFRVVYQFIEESQTVYILAVQHCRQKLPAERDLKRRKRQTDE
jgi:mRNA-degrading endonuclease RelE of RelBE toxin-antitoxin system